MLEKEINNVISEEYKIDQGILKLLTTKKSNKFKLYKNFLDINLKTLKRINKLPTADWQLELLPLNNIFAVVLGVIDARNDECERNLENFTNVQEMEDIGIKQFELQECRFMVVKDYESIFLSDDIKTIKDTIKSNPSYNNFNNLFEDIKRNNNDLSIQGELISAYMFGYNNFLNVSLEDVMTYYNKIISEYKLEKSKKVNSLVKNKIH